MEQELDRRWDEAAEGGNEAAEAIKRAAKVGVLRVALRLEMGTGKWGNQVDLEEVIARMQAKQASSYEEQVREHRLKEALRAKKELEDKLSFIADTITSLNAKPEAPSKRKAHRVMDKETRKIMLEAEASKRKESLEFAKRQMEIQRDRQKRRRLQVQQMADSLSQHIEQDRAQRGEIEQRLREEKERRMEMMRNQAEMRREELQMAKERVRSHVVTKAKALMPELEQRKKELASKRLLSHQLPESIQLHPDQFRLREPLEARKLLAPQLPVVEEEKQRLRKPRTELQQLPTHAHPLGSREALTKPSSASYRSPNPSIPAGERPASKPPLPRTKPAVDAQRRDKLQEAVEHFRASKSDWDSELPSLNHTQHLSSQGSKASLGTESRLSEGRPKAEDDVIASIRAKLSLQS
jgi:DNA repair exonuclease SbcCD ATPase subunit